MNFFIYHSQLYGGIYNLDVSRLLEVMDSMLILLCPIAFVVVEEHLL